MRIHGKEQELAEINLPAQLKSALVQLVNDDDFEGFLSGGQVKELLNSTGYTLPQLMQALIPFAQLYALPVISRYNVGAVGLGGSGALYFGANLEFLNNALSCSVHAEQAVVANAIDHDEKSLQMLAISAAPCGYCRQFLYETVTGANLTIFNPGETTLASLLPAPFGPQDLGIKIRLMERQDHNLSLKEPVEDTLINSALYAANVSYAPYTLSYAGVAVQTADGMINYGSCYENAAYNPTMSPLQAALVPLVMRGYDYSEISRVVLVEIENAKSSQYSATASVLASISQVPLEVYGAVE